MRFPLRPRGHDTPDHRAGQHNCTVAALSDAQRSIRPVTLLPLCPPVSSFAARRRLPASRCNMWPRARVTSPRHPLPLAIIFIGNWATRSASVQVESRDRNRAPTASEGSHHTRRTLLRIIAACRHQRRPRGRRCATSRRGPAAHTLALAGPHPVGPAHAPGGRPRPRQEPGNARPRRPRLRRTPLAERAARGLSPFLVAD